MSQLRGKAREEESGAVDGRGQLARGRGGGAHAGQQVPGE